MHDECPCLFLVVMVQKGAEKTHIFAFMGGALPVFSVQTRAESFQPMELQLDPPDL
jgi:hypothetical protein